MPSVPRHLQGPVLGLHPSLYELRTKAEGDRTSYETSGKSDGDRRTVRLVMLADGTVEEFTLGDSHRLVPCDKKVHDRFRRERRAPR